MTKSLFENFWLLLSGVKIKIIGSLRLYYPRSKVKIHRYGNFGIFIISYRNVKGSYFQCFSQAVFAIACGVIWQQAIAPPQRGNLEVYDLKNIAVNPEIVALNV